MVVCEAGRRDRLSLELMGQQAKPASELHIVKEILSLKLRYGVIKENSQ